MTAPTRPLPADELLELALAARASRAAPGDLRGRIEAAARQTPQTASRLPLAVAVRRAPGRRASRRGHRTDTSGRLTLVLMGALLMALLAAGAAVVGSRLSSPPADPLGGLVTEPVDGLERIVSDGADHELSGEAVWNVAFGRDGSVWMLGPSSLLQVGVPGSYPGLPEPRLHYDLTVGPDGTLWAIDGTTVASLVEGAWVSGPPGPGPVEALEVLPDGTVWARWRSAIGRLDDDRWAMHAFVDAGVELPEQGPYLFPGDFASTPDGRMWVAISKDGEDPGPQRLRPGGLAAFDGTTWELVRTLPDVADPFTAHVAAGPDGTLWAYHLVRGDPYLAHIQGSTVTIFDTADGVQRIGTPGCCVGHVAVGPDGTVWAASSQLRSFDGTRWTTRWQTETGAEFRAIAIAPDGTPWATTMGDGVMVYRP